MLPTCEIFLYDNSILKMRDDVNTNILDIEKNDAFSFEGNMVKENIKTPNANVGSSMKYGSYIQIIVT